jgi:hypothetical protein
MKNWLERGLWNIAPRNRTQTQYTRFLRTPHGELDTMFSKTKSAFEKRMQMPKLKTLSVYEWED